MTKYKVAIIKCPNYDYNIVKKSINDGLELIGGTNDFFHNGMNCLLKPNLLKAANPDKCVCTHPEITRVVAEMALEHGAKVRLGDSTGFGSTASVARAAGITARLSDLPVEVIEFHNKTTPSITENDRFRELTISNEALNADLLVNLPKIKTHGMMFYTLAIKNLFGTVVGHDKARYHFTVGKDRILFARMLVEVARHINSGLTIVDGIIGMEGNGPGSGTPRKLGYLVFGTHPAAVDLVLLKLLNTPVERQLTSVVAQQMNWGPSDWSEIELLGDDITPLIVKDFKPARPVHSRELVGNSPFMKFLENAYATKPVVNEALCTQCKICVNSCPAEAICLSEKAIKYDYDKCIRCYICQELCPSEAISVDYGWLMKMLPKL